MQENPVGAVWHSDDRFVPVKLRQRPNGKFIKEPAPWAPDWAASGGYPADHPHIIRALQDPEGYVALYLGDKYVDADQDTEQIHVEADDGTVMPMTLETGRQAYEDLCRDAGIEPPLTRTVRSISGGSHALFMRDPDRPMSHKMMGHLEIRTGERRYQVIYGRGYECDSTPVTRMPEQLRSAIEARGAFGRRAPGGAQAVPDGPTGEFRYGNYETAFNNLLTGLKGFLVQGGAPQDVANSVVRFLNSQVPDPIDDEALESTVLRDKGWDQGTMVPEQLVRLFNRPATLEIDLESAGEHFTRLLADSPEYQKKAMDMAFRKWFQDRLRTPTAGDTTSWDEVAIGELLGDEAAATISPDRLTKATGASIAYSGAVHWIWGEPGHGKTVLCLLWASQEMKAGRPVVWMDLENQARLTVEKLLTIFGCTRQQIREHFHLVQPNDALTAEARDVFLGVVRRTQPSLVVIDAMNDLITLQGGKHNDVEPISVIDQRLLQPCKAAGAAVAVIDHVAKNAETRGWPINSGHKKAVTEVGFQVVNVAPFTRSTPGYSKITCHKDRQGTHANDSEVGFLIVAGGEAVLSADVAPMLQLSAVTVLQGEVSPVRELTSPPSARRTEILSTIGEAPGEYSVNGLATALSAQFEVSAKTVERDIKAMVGTLIRQDDSRLYLTDTATESS